MSERASRRARPWRASIAAAAALALPLMLGACSQVPSWANPAEWILDSEPEEPTRVSAEASGGGGEAEGQTADAEGEEEFPNLGDVPEAPEQPSSRAERQALSESLAADRSNAQYSDEALQAEEATGGTEGRVVREATTSGEIPEVPETTGSETMSSATTGGASTSTAGGQASAGQTDGGMQSSEGGQQMSRTSDETAASWQQTTEAPAVSGRSPRMLQSQQGEPVRVVSGSAPAQPVIAEADGDGQSAGQQAGAGMTQTARSYGGPPLGEGGRRVAVIYFGHGSANLDSRDRNVLRDVVAIRQQRGGSLRVVGHASSRTEAMDIAKHRMANFEMSLHRAEAVGDVLVSMGVPAERVVVQARSDTQPVYQETMPTGEAGNRRVEIFLQ